MEPERISKLTDILVALLLSVVVCTLVLIYLGDHPYYFVLAIALAVLANLIYIILKIKSKPPSSSDSS